MILPLPSASPVARNFAVPAADFDPERMRSFVAAQRLRTIATQAVGPRSVLDLAQGQPGYGAAPSSRARRFYAGCVLVDASMNVRVPSAGKGRSLLDRVRSTARKVLGTSDAPAFLTDLEVVVNHLTRSLDLQGTARDTDMVLGELFDHSNLSGSLYPQPEGNLALRALLAEEHMQYSGVSVLPSEIIPVSGASHGVATIFSALGEECIGFLKRGDMVLTVSPIYAPFVELFDQRGIVVRSIEIDPRTGEPEKESLECARALTNVKAIFLTSPNNPTGQRSSNTLLGEIAALAARNDAVIVVDEAYAGFFEELPTIGAFAEARRRTIWVSSLSKIERSAGLRVGAVCLREEANSYLSGSTFATHLRGRFRDLRELLTNARSPGGVNIGLFSHIAGLPGPSAALALCELTLGTQERALFVSEVAAKSEHLQTLLGVPNHGSRYFLTLDLRDVSAAARRKSASDIFAGLALKGLVLMPACRFFSVEGRRSRDTSYYARIAVPNLTWDKLRLAAKLIVEAK